MRINPEDLGKLGRDAQQQILAHMALDVVRKRKYNNQPTEVDGIRFDSQKEAERFRELKLMAKAGQITDLKLQPEFTLQEAYTTPDGEKVRAIRYRADFSYRNDKGLVIEDVKSDATRKNKTYQLKRKLMLEKGYKVTEVL